MADMSTLFKNLAKVFMLNKLREITVQEMYNFVEFLSIVGSIKEANPEAILCSILGLFQMG